MDHFIKKITVDLNINERKDAYEFQNKVSDLFRRRLNKLTETILDEFSNPSVTIQIPLLEIDLGDIRSNFFEADFLKYYEKQLREAIAKQVRKSRSNTSIASTSQTVTAQPTQQSQLEILVFYLENGRLPANAPKDINLNELLQNILNSQKALVLQTLKPLIKQKKVIHRLVYAFSTQNTEQLLQHFAPQSFTPIQTAMQNVFSIFKSNLHSIRRQKLHKQLLLIAMELLQQSVIKTNNFNLNLDSLNAAFLKVLPKEWQQTQNPIHSTSFVIQEEKNLNLKEVATMPYKQVKQLLRQAENRHQIITNGNQQQLFVILDTLSADKSAAIQKIIQDVLTNKPETARAKTLRNIVWSTILEYLSFRQSPSDINTTKLTKAIKKNPIIRQLKQQKQLQEQYQKQQQRERQQREQQREQQRQQPQAVPPKSVNTLNIQTLLDLPYIEVKQLLTSNENQQRIVTTSKQQELFDLVTMLSGEHFADIQKIIKEIIDKIDNKQFTISPITLKNIIWSITLEYLAKSQSTKTIRVQTIKQNIENRLQEINDKQTIINKTKEEFTKNKALTKEQELAQKEQQKPLNEELQKQQKEQQKSLNEELQKQQKEQQKSLNEELQKQQKEQQKPLNEELQKQQKEQQKSLNEELQKQQKEQQKSLNEELQKQQKEQQKPLNEELQPITTNKIEESKPQIIQLNYRPEDILEIYLLNGYFIQPMESHEILLINLLDNQPRQLRILLTRIGKSTTIIQRLINNISIETLQRLTYSIVTKPLFINTLEKNLTTPQTINLYQIAIRHQLKYGQVESTFLFSEFVDNWTDELNLEAFVQSLSDDLKAIDDTYYLPMIEDYLASVVVINPIEKEEEEEYFVNATRFLDFLTQFIENPTNNWWSKNLTRTEFNRHFQEVAHYYPDAVKTAFYKIMAQKNAATILTDLLEEENLILLMNLVEPNMFGYISTIILTFNDFMSSIESWELTLVAYSNTPKPLNVNIFTQQAYLRFAKKTGQTQSEIQQALLEYAEKQIQLKQHRFQALKQIILNDIRFKQQPEILTEPASVDLPETANQPFDSNIEIISYYLKYNTLPKEYQHFTEADIIRTIKLQGIKNLNILKIALRKILDNPTYSKRLTTLPEPIITTLIQTLQPKVGLKILPFLEDLKQVIDHKTLIISILRVVNEITILTHKAGFVQHFIVSMVEILSNTTNQTTQESLKSIIEAMSDKPQQSNIVKQLRRVLARMNKQADEVTVDDKPVAVVEKPITPLKDTAIYIDYAGVAILNVFFPHLFKMFDLTEKRKFKDLESACRAAYMIHYIATGNPTPLEHQLILSKIMCGIPIEQPINSIIVLTEEEKEACNQLIKAGINRWKKMQNASVEGFRNSFLKREGKLVKISKGWTLSVEQKTFDLILKTLPWGFSMIRFGWMEDTIYVEWAY